ncbi:hypothetical protein BT69DRAFT_1280369 [Atractiella rhizophila]|nr:hypothetical protein BT69DRAFT_1280369 [Atractiella rhizophila]
MRWCSDPRTVKPSRRRKPVAILEKLSPGRKEYILFTRKKAEEIRQKDATITLLEANALARKAWRTLYDSRNPPPPSRSQYESFIKAKGKELQSENSTLSAKQAQDLAREAWKRYKDSHKNV